MAGVGDGTLTRLGQLLDGGAPRHAPLLRRALHRAARPNLQQQPSRSWREGPLAAAQTAACNQTALLDRTARLAPAVAHLHQRKQRLEANGGIHDPGQQVVACSVMRASRGEQKSGARARRASHRRARMCRCRSATSSKVIILVYSPSAFSAAPVQSGLSLSATPLTAVLLPVVLACGVTANWCRRAGWRLGVVIPKAA